MTAPEWQFTEPPDQVDIERLWLELRTLPAIYAYAYLAELKTKAPETYIRLRDVRVAAGCTIFNWQDR